jgi:hypothetical protein
VKRGTKNVKPTVHEICRMALALGQDAELIAEVERGEIHPAMAAFGLWRDEPDLEDLAEEISAERERVVGRLGLMDEDSGQ